MKLKLMKDAVTSKIGRQVLKGQKNSPTILFVGGVVGIVGTVVLASRATLKLEGVLEESQEAHETARTLQHRDYSNGDRQRDHAYIYARTAVKVGKLYAPAVALGTVSICALTGSHVILSRRNVALTAAYSALDKGFREYRSRVIEELGGEKDREFRYGLVAQEYWDGEPGAEIKTQLVATKDSSSIYARVFDECSPSWSREPFRNQFFIRCQQTWANDMLNARGHVFLNEVYDMLGLPRSKEGAVVGWVKNGDGDGYVDFGVFDNDVWIATQFVNGQERSIWLDFNVDGVIFDKI